MGRTQTWLGERMGELHGRRPYGQSTVGTWMARTEPTPELVFDLERALDLPPGHLSRLLGYVPVSVTEVSCTVPEAIEADPMLDGVVASVLAGFDLSDELAQGVVGAGACAVDGAGDPSFFAGAVVSPGVDLDLPAAFAPGADGAPHSGRAGTLPRCSAMDASCAHFSHSGFVPLSASYQQPTATCAGDSSKSRTSSSARPAAT